MDHVQVGTDEVLDQASAEFEGQWNRLISQTNWDKGRIICAWRAALQAAGAPITQLSDDCWSQRVGGVSGQHVGRLRRVWDRFGSERQQYPGLYWSHFQAALDWNDPELWLEGAVGEGWSVAQMRQQRATAMGAPEGLAPADEDVIAMRLEEERQTGEEIDESGVHARPGVVSDVGHGDADDDSPRGRSENDDREDYDADDDHHDATSADSTRSATAVAPFATLAELPDDLADAFESFKLAIVRHRQSEWADVAAADVLATLEALKQLVLAPAEA